MDAVKVVLVGEAGVGKTSIISRFTKNSFNPDEVTSSSAQFTSKTITINDNKIKFDIWDTAGQEKFRAITKIFYKDAQVIVFVYEITTISTFEAIKDYWYKESSDNSTAEIFFVVGNKSDLYENEQVSDEEGKKFAKEIHGIYKSTSALSGGGIDRLFESIGKKILDPNYNGDDEGDIKVNAENKSNLNKKKDTIQLSNQNDGVKIKKKCC